LGRRAALAVGSLIRESEWRLKTARLAYGHGTFGPRDEAAYLTLKALSLPPDVSPKVLTRVVSAASARRVRKLVGRRIRSRKPAAYLTREAWLGKHCFYVDARVIVPRSHIAALLEERLSPWLPVARKVNTVLDLCTGSGCLAILAALAFPRARVDAADISAAALAVASINVKRYALARRIQLLKSDLFSALGGKRYDLIVCNPPYVTAASMRRLPREYRHEPGLALAGGKDGLDLARVILKRAAQYLAPGGLLAMEVGDGRRRVERAFPRTGFTWAEVPGGGDVLVVERGELPR